MNINIISSAHNLYYYFLSNIINALQLLFIFQSSFHKFKTQILYLNYVLPLKYLNLK